MKTRKKQTQEKPKRELSAAEVEQRRNAARQPRTVTEAGLAARQRNAQLSTGPKTEEGKAVVSRNAWKTGEHSALAKGEMWQQIGMGMSMKPCKSTCEQYPCAMVENGSTKPGGDCLDMTTYMQAFNALMDVLHSGDARYAHGVMAAHGAQALDLLQRVWEELRNSGAMLERPIINKQGEVVYTADGTPATIKIRHPLMNDVPKLLQQLGISLPEMLATPKAVLAVETGKEVADVMSELMGRVGRAVQSGSGPVRRRTIDVTPESKDFDDAEGGL